ncbi:MAG: AAA family ATPase [Magnetococcales bacterium]|nr:AAA family ATPase [Magnetococcales bacterium]
MLIDCVEIQNFRKLKSVRIDVSEKTTLFVGANNSGKTTAITALRYFFQQDQSRFNINDFLLSNHQKIDAIGRRWIESNETETPDEKSLTQEWVELLPSMDVWLTVGDSEVGRVRHLIPTLTWAGGSLGVRLRFQPKSFDNLRKEFIKEFDKKKTVTSDEGLKIWPESLIAFLQRRLDTHFVLRTYCLEPDKREEAEHGIARPQTLPDDREPLDFEHQPFNDLILIDVINAQRGFSDSSSKPESSSRDQRPQTGSGHNRKFSRQLQHYYRNHLDTKENIDTYDLGIWKATQKAQEKFDEALEKKFEKPLEEMRTMGYPGVTDPKINIKTKIDPVKSIDHDTSVQLEVGQQNGSPLHLPEDYNGLGYQNLYSMYFQLIAFRDAWVKKKPEKSSSDNQHKIPPLHLVLVEEPEAHLHAQVQQVFIRQAHDVLRKHSESENGSNHLETQLIVSTHSSHIAHECEFKNIRYFRRKPISKSDNVPISAVVNLSEVFGKDEDETARFVKRYLKATHSDLFFADGAILVEGAAERMLIPHFIQNSNLETLKTRYITLLEINGSYAYLLEPLIRHLGLTTLIISDIDSVDESRKKTQPAREMGLKTNNPTLKTWHPGKECQTIDALYEMDPSKRILEYTKEEFSIRVAYQLPVSVTFNKKEKEALPYTFEDALVFENFEIFRTLQGTGMVGKFHKAVSMKTFEEICAEIFNVVDEGGKAQFALDLIFDIDPTKLKIPHYIREGLEWLQVFLTKTKPN